MENPAAKRVSFEAYGSDGSWHNPNWGNLRFPRTSKVTGFINNPNSLTTRQELFRESSSYLTRAVIETIKKTYPSYLFHLRDLISSIERGFLSYGTSGTEMNSKEMLQMLASLLIQKDKLPMIYFIDTGSHPIGNQLELEALVYAAYAKQNGINLPENELYQLYRNSFRLKNFEEVKEYIPQNLRDAWREEWSNREEKLSVPGYFVSVKKVPYLTFLQSIGVSEEVLEIIESCFGEQTEISLNELYPKLSTYLMKYLLEKLGINSEFFCLSFDDLMKETPFSQLTLGQIGLLIEEIFGEEKVRSFNLICPDGVEKSVNLSGRIGKEDLVLTDTRYDSICYTGHLSGMGYYLSLMLLGGNPGISFILDNYEASGPHERIHNATPWRIRDGEARGPSFIQMPRGWIRVDGFEIDQDLTYGFSPPLPVVVDWAVRESSNLEVLRRYLDWLGKNIGNNCTIFLDFGRVSKIFVIPDNLAFVKRLSPEGKGISVEKRLQIKPFDVNILQNLRDALHEFLRSGNEQKLKAFFDDSDITDILKQLDFFPRLKDISSSLADTIQQIMALEQKLEEIDTQFTDENASRLSNYYRALVEVLMSVAGEFGIDVFQNDDDSNRRNEIKLLNGGPCESWKEWAHSYDLLHSRVKNELIERVKESVGNMLKDEGSKDKSSNEEERLINNLKELQIGLTTLDRFYSIKRALLTLQKKQREGMLSEKGKLLALINAYEILVNTDFFPDAEDDQSDKRNIALLRDQIIKGHLTPENSEDLRGILEELDSVDIEEKLLEAEQEIEQIKIFLNSSLLLSSEEKDGKFLEDTKSGRKNRQELMQRISLLIKRFRLLRFINGEFEFSNGKNLDSLEEILREKFISILHNSEDKEFDGEELSIEDLYDLVYNDLLSKIKRDYFDGFNSRLNESKQSKLRDLGLEGIDEEVRIHREQLSSLLKIKGDLEEKKKEFVELLRMIDQKISEVLGSLLVIEM